MLEEVEAYMHYFESFGEIKKPIMPNFSVSAYTDNEYLSVIYSVQNDFESIDDFEQTIQHLKGE